MRLRLGIGIASLPLFVPACFSSTAVDDVPFVPPVDDSGADAGPGTDATILEAAAPEAAPSEASTPTPDAAPTTVTVVVVNDRGPEPGATIVFQDAAGNVLTSGVTDATGSVTQVVVAGGQVTAILGTPENIQLVTIEGVTPGDVLTAHDATSTTFANAQVSIDSLPAAPPPGTASYQLNIGNCGTSFTDLPVQIQLSPDCENLGTFPVLVQAFNGDPEGPAAIGFTYQNVNALPLDGGTAHVSMSGAWSTASAAQTISVTNFLDPGLSGFTTYSENAGGVAFGPPAFITPDADGGATSVFPVHAGYPVSVQNEANVSAFRNGGVAVSAIATRSAPSADGGAVSFDLSTLLPLLDAVNVDSSQPAQPTVSWTTEAGSLAAATGTIVVLNWTASDDAGDVSGTWTIVAPPTATSVKAPALPASMAAWAPSANASFLSPPTVIVVQGQGALLSSYAGLRGQFASVPATSSLLYDQLGQSGVVPPLPADGTLKLTAFTLGE